MLERDLAILMEIERLEEEGRYSQLDKLISESGYFLSESGRSLGRLSQSSYSEEELRRSSYL
jgi:hypothetical protein